MFCKHNWKVLDKTVVPSKAEEMMKCRNGFTGLKGAAFPFDLDTLLKVTVVISLTCEKCGKLTVVRETN